jgi:hypothetical protein
MACKEVPYIVLMAFISSNAPQAIEYHKENILCDFVVRPLHTVLKMTAGAGNYYVCPSVHTFYL